MTENRPKIRLYVPEAFTPGVPLVLEGNPAHYLSHVMRAQIDDAIAIFNGQDGEWLARIGSIGKKQLTIDPVSQIAPQENSPDLWLAFSPIKAKTEFVVEKATELGVAKIITVITRYAVVRSVNHEKLVANAVEAAEQCGRHDVPDIENANDLAAFLGNWPKDRTLLYADESGGGDPVKEVLASLAPGKYGILVGPEGGFSDEERRMLAIVPQVKPFSMGARILRADTASVAALACVQAWLGDWDALPSFKAER